ncbi:flagellar basal body P-ring formation chaperone FlgA [Undibacterium sp. TJN25]|uniref:flagellar basal body P-ring formation chaperone FlgA n=1 Tax=Undibacterium sp. TJN25 TaxID=3413056 RepID=UPI003BF3A371
MTRPLTFLHMAFLLASGCMVSMACAAGSSTSVQVDLSADVAISQKRFTLGQIAVVKTDDNEIRKTVESLEVGQAPRVGYVEQYTKEELDRLIHSRVPLMRAALDWHGAKAVKVRAAGHSLDNAKVVESAREYLAKELGAKFKRVELNSAAPVADIELPTGEVSMTCRPLEMGRLYSRAPIWVDIRVNGEVYRSVVVTFTIKVAQEVYVAKRDLPAGTIALPSDFETRTEDVTDNPEGLVSANGLSEATRLRKAVGRGQMLRREQLSPEGLVFRGDSVKLILAEGGVVIETRAIAQQDGVVGQLVKVKPETSAEAFSGRVLVGGVVQVEGK